MFYDGDAEFPTSTCYSDSAFFVFLIFGLRPSWCLSRDLAYRLELMLTFERVSVGITATNENSNHSSRYSSIVCGDSGMFCSEPAHGHVETQRGKIESGSRNGQEHDCYLLGAGR